jgi:hypothetical protein
MSNNGLIALTCEEWKEENSDPTELLDDVAVLVLLDVNLVDGSQLKMLDSLNIIIANENFHYYVLILFLFRTHFISISFSTNEKSTEKC